MPKDIQDYTDDELIELATAWGIDPNNPGGPQAINEPFAAIRDRFTPSPSQYEIHYVAPNNSLVNIANMPDEDPIGAKVNITLGNVRTARFWHNLLDARASIYTQTTLYIVEEEKSFEYAFMAESHGYNLNANEIALYRNVPTESDLDFTIKLTAIPWVNTRLDGLKNDAYRAGLDISSINNTSIALQFNLVTTILSAILDTWLSPTLEMDYRLQLRGNKLRTGNYIISKTPLTVAIDWSNLYLEGNAIFDRSGPFDTSFDERWLLLNISNAET